MRGLSVGKDSDAEWMAPLLQGRPYVSNGGLLKMATHGRGSWELQRHIEKLNWQGKFNLHKTLMHHYWYLSAHPHGNYIVSQLCEAKVCLPEMLTIFKRSLYRVCEDVYSCRVLQTLIKVCSVEDILSLIDPLTDSEIYDLCTGKHGSWSISALYLKTLSFKIRNVVFTFAPTLSTHNCGTRVVQNVFKMTAMHGLSIERGVDSLIHSKCVLSLTTHMYMYMFGNYLVHICLEMSNPQQRFKLFDTLGDNIVSISFNKYGSTVGEKIVEHASSSDIERMGVVIVDNPALMYAFVMSRCANYVLSSLLSRSSGPMLHKGISYLSRMQHSVNQDESVKASYVLDRLSKIKKM